MCEGSNSNNSFDERNRLNHALGGLSSGIFGTIVGYPLELVKTRMQNTVTDISYISSRVTVCRTLNNKISCNANGYKGMTSTISKIIRKEGLPSLYKGVMTPMISLSIISSYTFTAYNTICSALNASRGWDIKNAIAGVLISPLTSSISTVEHVTKTQMQLDNVREKFFKNSWHCIKHLVHANGWKILYTGHIVNSIREGMFLASYFYIYEGIRSRLIGSDICIHESLTYNLPLFLIIPTSGGITGSSSWFISFPLDCVKTQIQGQTLLHSLNRNIYISKFILKKRALVENITTIDVIKILLKKRGLFGLYIGVKPSIIRSFLTSASRFSIYEFVVCILQGKKNTNFNAIITD